MTPYQPKRVFQQDLESSHDKTASLLAQQQFDEATFTPESVSPSLLTESDDVDLDTVIRPRNQSPWFWRLSGSAFIGLVGWQAVDTITAAYQNGEWLTLGWAALVTAIAGVGLSQLLKEWFTLRSLRKHFTRQAEAEALIQSQRVGQATELCRKMIDEAGSNGSAPAIESQHVAEWEKHLNAAYNDGEVLALFDVFVLKHLDDKAIQLISRYATESAALVAVSPLAITDMLLVAWRNLAMINRLSDLYGVRLGYWSRIRLLRTMFVNMAAAGASEIAIDAGTDLLSAGLAGKISARAGQGVGVGILTARLGLQAVTLLRPLPWVPERKAKLTRVRKAIVSRVLALVKKP
ncbi:YcjF family protein [Vibrio rhizosphaerae]|uniref:TIGR01620 family protein n=1 Tax=Vibrio rhizosphaerae TaxID=398736 RepID=A0ABU4IUH1_9VIBR|nr:TIGR01620 family protein [Vibrio rhizosphaerae]MDW6093047.1 TIGR01620 family protein [Vibrio rhizosphaerae]